MEAKRKAKQAKQQNTRLQAKRLGKLQYLLLHDTIKIYVSVCMHAYLTSSIQSMYIHFS